MSNTFSPILHRVLKNIDLEDLVDQGLHFAHLEHRRPVMKVATAVGFISLGALAAIGSITFIPSVRRAFFGEGGFLETATREVKKAMSGLKETGDDVKIEAKKAVNKAANAASHALG